MYIIILYDVTGCFCLGSLLRLTNCTAERKQNEARKKGRTCLAEAVPSCRPSTEAEGFLIAGQLRPDEPDQNAQKWRCDGVESRTWERAKESRNTLRRALKRE